MVRKTHKKIAIDFDGCIHDWKNKLEGHKMGQPINGVEQALRDFQQLEFQIIIYSVWGMPENEHIIKDWMDFYGLPFDRITNLKPNADFYIDDKALRFEGQWEPIVSIVANS
jgi:hypothetical protein